MGVGSSLKQERVRHKCKQYAIVKLTTFEIYYKHVSFPTEKLWADCEPWNCLHLFAVSTTFLEMRQTKIYLSPNRKSIKWKPKYFTASNWHPVSHIITLWKKCDSFMHVFQIECGWKTQQDILVEDMEASRKLGLRNES